MATYQSSLPRNQPKIVEGQYRQEEARNMHQMFSFFPQSPF